MRTQRAPPRASRTPPIFQPAPTAGFDHFAFRTFGLPHLGISSVATLFEDFGYQQRDQLAFPAKKLKALWYSPPAPDLPRIFVSELQVKGGGGGTEQGQARVAGAA